MQTRWIKIISISLMIMSGCTKDRTGQTSSIPNGDFENWTTAPRLMDWKTNSCPECTPAFETYIVQKDSTSFHGRYAARFVYNNEYPAWAENKFSLSVHPLFLGGYFKCNLNGTDTISVKIWLYKNEAIVDSGEWLGTTSIPDYSHIGIPISQHVSQIDTAIIRITGGHKPGNLPANTVFWADYLDLE
jgi:hypothetical protein